MVARSPILVASSHRGELKQPGTLQRMDTGVIESPRGVYVTHKVACTHVSKVAIICVALNHSTAFLEKMGFTSTLGFVRSLVGNCCSIRGAELRLRGSESTGKFDVRN